MKSLAQIRAANALAASKIQNMGRGQKDGDALSGFPMLIQTNGLLAASANAIELNKKGELKHLGEFIIVFSLVRHLADPQIAIYKPDLPDSSRGELPAQPIDWPSKRPVVEQFIKQLAESSDSSQLRRATSEALAFLGYLKRFVA